MAEAAYENPLIPNARLRQIYLAMLRARMLGRALPSRKRGGWARGVEACLVSTSIDLGAGDLVSDALAGGVVEFLRGAGLRAVLGGNKGGVVADCGGAKALPMVRGTSERLWAAMGAAAALKGMKVGASAEDKTAEQTGVVVVYVTPGEVAASVWRNMLGFAAEQFLPVFFVLLPTSGVATKSSGIGALARSAGVPLIAADQDDAVAIYRVAQESIGRARAGGGAAVMECVPYILPGAKGKQAAPDAITALERYILQRGVATQAWMDREARTFARRLAGS